jgi:hypothetical protein
MWHKSALDGITKFIENVKNFIKNLDDQSVGKTIIDQSEIVKMVRIQLAKGIDGNDLPVYLVRPMPDGARFTYYAYATEKKKLSSGVGLGSVTDVVTNFMSGGFYESLYVEILPKGYFEVRSSSELWDIIKVRSGEDIINLSPSSAQFLLENQVAPDFQQVINELYEV